MCTASEEDARDLSHDRDEPPDPIFGDKPLNAIRTCDVEDFMAATLAECSPAYVNNCARTMTALLTHAVSRPRERLHSAAHEKDKEVGRAALGECRKRAVLSRYVFISSDGRRTPEIAVRRAFLRAKRIAGITRRFRFHDLRHTAACTLASAGVSLQVIQKILGHTSIKMTERYIRVDENAIAEARRALDAKAASLGSDPKTESRWLLPLIAEQAGLCPAPPVLTARP